MVIKFDHRHKKLDGDLLLTVACPNECDFCIYSCTASKEPSKWMPEETIRKVAEEYSKNDIGIRISGGEPFYDLSKLERCIDILLEYYKPIELLIITSGFFAINKKETEKHLNVIKRKSIDTVVVSVDRFHQKVVPLSNILNLLTVAKEMNIQIILRVSLDQFSFHLIDSISEIIAKYKIPIELHNWNPIGKAEKLDKSPLQDFYKVREDFFSKIKYFAEKYNTPIDLNYYLTYSPKRSQRQFCPDFFPTTFPNGNVYGCSSTTKLGYMGNINKEHLLDMIFKWKKTLPGFFVTSKYSCQILREFLPNNLNNYYHCEFCKNQPFDDENLPEEAIGRKFVKIYMNMDFEELVKNLSKYDKEYLLSFRFIEDDLNVHSGDKIKDFLKKLKNNGIRFILSRPLPKCLGIRDNLDAPKSCWECRELFTVEDGQIKLCRPLGNIILFEISKTTNRRHIYEYSKTLKERLNTSVKCVSCLFKSRGQCSRCFEMK